MRPSGELTILIRIVPPFITVLLTLAALTACSSSPPLSAACQKAVSAQNAYAKYAASVGYPNVPAFSNLAFTITAR